MARESKAEKIALERGLPVAIQEERLVLASILLDDSCYASIENALKPEHFALEIHQTIYRVIREIKDAGDRADRITLGSILYSRGKLEQIGGLAYLTSLEEGMPNLPNLSGYVRVIRDKADLRGLIAAGQALMDSALLGSESPEKIAAAAANQVSQISSGMISTKTAYSFSDTVDEAGGLDQFLAPRTDGVSTGYPYLDKIIYGLEPGLLYIIGGDSGHGKSSFAGNIVSNVVFGNTGTEWSSDPHPCGYFSLEMSKKALFTRMLCSRARVSSWKLKKGFMKAEERRAMNLAAGELAGAPLYIDATKGLSVREFRTRVKRMKRELGIKVAMLDYLQLLNWQEDGLRSEYEGITFITRTLAEIAADEQLAVVALTQFNQEYSRRKDKAQRPTVDACHGSGSIKKDADVVLLLYRLSQAHPGVADQANRVECIVGKQRDGRSGTMILDWQGKWTTFVEAPEDVQPEKDTDQS